MDEVSKPRDWTGDHRTRLKKSGGRRIEVELTAQGAAKLDEITRAVGSKKAAVHAAIMAYRKVRKP